jgi:hypothetical protein
MRLVLLASVPETLWIDDVTVIQPALALTGHWRDFTDTVRSLLFGETPGTSGVLYLEYLRLMLVLFGISASSLRLPATLAGIVSMITTGLLARRLLPRGGATLAIIVIAGLYWSVTMSRIGTIAMVITPLIDIATILLLYAKRQLRIGLSLCAGAVAGLGTHVYLSAWVAAAALILLSLLPSNSPATVSTVRRRLLVTAFFVLGFALTVSPLFIFRAGRSVPYFLRTRQANVINDMRYWRSPLPAFEAASDGITAPWLLSSKRWWPENVQLGFVLRALLAIAFFRALVRPRDDLSMVIVAQSATALAATVVGGNRGVPNGFRFGYLSDVSAVAIAGGALWILLLARRSRRRVLATAVVGLLGVGSLLGVREFFLYFSGRPGHDPTSEATLVARTALRWERYGAVEIDPHLLHFKVMVAAIRHYRLDPEDTGQPADALYDVGTARGFRIVRPGTVPRPGERAVEVVRGEGWTCAVVLGKRGSRPRGAGGDGFER